MKLVKEDLESIGKRKSCCGSHRHRLSYSHAHKECHVIVRANWIVPWKSWLSEHRFGADSLREFARFGEKPMTWGSVWIFDFQHCQGSVQTRGLGHFELSGIRTQQSHNKAAKSFQYCTHRIVEWQPPCAKYLFLFQVFSDKRFWVIVALSWCFRDYLKYLWMLLTTSVNKISVQLYLDKSSNVRESSTATRPTGRNIFLDILPHSLFPI